MWVLQDSFWSWSILSDSIVDEQWLSCRLIQLWSFLFNWSILLQKNYEHTRFTWASPRPQYRQESQRSLHLSCHCYQERALWEGKICQCANYYQLSRFPDLCIFQNWDDSLSMSVHYSLFVWKLAGHLHASCRCRNYYIRYLLQYLYHSRDFAWFLMNCNTLLIACSFKRLQDRQLLLVLT